MAVADLKSSIADSVSPGNQYFKGNNAGLNREGRRQSGQKSAAKAAGSGGGGFSMGNTPPLSAQFNYPKRDPNHVYLMGSWKDAGGKVTGWMRLDLNGLLKGDGYGPYATIN